MRRLFRPLRWRDRSNPLPGLAIPDQNTSLSIPGHHGAAIRRTCHTVKPRLDLAEVPLQPAIRCVVHADQLVAATRDDAVSFANVLDRRHVACELILDRQLLVGGLGVPDLDDVVRTGTYKRLAVSLPVDPQDIIRVPFETPQLLSGGDIERSQILVSSS